MSLSLRAAPVLCRPARASDRAPAFEFLRAIWNGTDYLPEVWDEWLADPAGLFAAAEQGGRVVGLARLADLGWGEGWLEGLRVDPRAEGRGIGSHLHDHLLAAWARTGWGVLRLATHAARAPVHRMCARTGFERVGEVVKHVAQSRPGEPRFEPLSPRDAAAAAARFAGGPGAAGLIEVDWKWAEPLPPRLEALAQRGWLWAWDGGRAVVLAEIDRSGDPPALRLYGLGADEGDLAPLLTDCRALAAAHGLAQAHWRAPAGEVRAAALRAAGYAAEWDAPIVLYEKRR